MLAALEIATGKVVAHVRNRRTSVNFLRFMNDVVRAYGHRELHVVVDNLNIHKNEAARDGSAAISKSNFTTHPRMPPGEPDRVLLQHSQQAGLGAQRCSTPNGT